MQLTTVVRGSDGAPYVLDTGTKTVWRIDLAKKSAAAVYKSGETVGAATAGDPKLITIGGPDVLILDTKNVLWRWRPADAKGRGTVIQIKVRESSSWGNDIVAIGTFCRTADCALYNLYVVDPSQKQILTYSPAADGSGYPAAPTGRLATARDVSQFTQMYIDGDIFVVDGGVIQRFVGGRDDGWKTDDPADTLLRPAPEYRLMASFSAARTGAIYGYDPASARVIAFQKATGSYIEQYLLPTGDTAWRDVRGMYAEPGPATDAPTTLFWIERDRLESAVLEASLGGLASPSPGDSVSPSPSATASAKP